MKLSQEAKSLIAMMALVLAIVLALNMAVGAEANRDMFSWTVGLLAVAILFWIWMRRDALAAQDADAVEAADGAAREAEALARRTIVRHDSEPAPAGPDDLTKINGVGAVFQSLLNDAGISSFAQLAATPLDELERIFEAADRNRPPRLETWPVQAEFAVNGDWAGLRDYVNSA